MKPLFVLIALALPSAFIASPATAAPSNGERYAACVIKLRPGEARELLQASTLNAAAEPYRVLIDDNRCIERVFGERPFSPQDDGLSQNMLRGNLAEQMLLKQLTKVATLQALPLQEKHYIRPWFAATARHPAVDEMAACMADTDPADITALIKSESGSADESAAYAAMSPGLTKCLAAGTRLDGSRQALRAALADALYQRLNNPALSLAEMKGTPQ